MLVRRLRSVARLAPLPLLVACSTTEPVVDDEDVRTAAVVDPAEFLGELPCMDAEGAPRSYRATLVDVETGEDLVRSEILSCDRSVAFEGVTIGASYGARIDVFDAPPEAASSPAWVTTCGLEGGAAVIVQDERRTIRGCAVLTGSGTAQTSVAIDATAAARAADGCVDEGGTLDALEVRVVEPADSLLPTIALACGQAPAVYGAEIVPGQRYEFELVARDEAGELVAGATCSAVARAGIVVEAECGPLTSAGALVFPIVDALADASLECGDGAESASVSLDAGPTSLAEQRVPCTADAIVAPVEAGAYVGTLRLLGPDGVLKAASCTGIAEPGVRRALVCTPE